jgi:hypothetical protein
MVGPSWVIFTVMGAREFVVHGKGINPAGGAMLGMSILLGGRGLGALVGPLISARWAGQNDHRLRLGILFGYLTIALGYGLIGVSHSVWIAAACAMLAHAGARRCGSSPLRCCNSERKIVFVGAFFPPISGSPALRLTTAAYLWPLSRYGDLGTYDGCWYRFLHADSGGSAGVVLRANRFQQSRSAS